jgi:malonate-semialdehyde dehydrogenase (acetylating)/methylmalonate-semialdehyde dehydrogenase
MLQRLENFVDGTWRPSRAVQALKVLNPASAQALAEVPLSPAEEVDAAAVAAQKAFPEWRRRPAGERIQPLFKLKALLEENLDDLARSVTNECGKTYAESVGELRRVVENVEVACGIPSLMQGYNSEDIALGIDEHMIRQPLGVVAAITPFNFPAMIPFWFMPYALATGNCFILKPSERVPLTSNKLFHLLEVAGFPPGVVQLVNGSKETVNSILDHPAIRAISFVGSTATARHIYSRAAANGRRGQKPGGGHAGCRYGDDHQDPGRLCLRLRGPALPGSRSRHYCGRGEKCAGRAVGRSCQQPQGGLWIGSGRGDGAGDLGRE